MKKNKLILLVSSFLITIGILFSINNKVQASKYLNGNTYGTDCTRYVKVTKPIRVYKVRTGKCEAMNHFKYIGKLKKGSKVWISHWLMSTGGGWVIMNDGKYYTDHRTFFFAHNPRSNRANWYKRIY